MRIAVLGGSGKLGQGLCVRWAGTGHQVMVGSRDQTKGQELARQYLELARARFGHTVQIDGGSNLQAAEGAEVVVLAVPHPGLESLLEQVPRPGGLIICPVVPMKRASGGFLHDPGPDGSAAARVARAWGANGLVAAMHTLPAAKLASELPDLEQDALLAADDQQSASVCAALISELGVRVLMAGGLAVAPVLESLTPMILNVARLGRLHDLGLKLIG